MSLLLVPPPPELTRPSRFYQGCGRVIKGSRFDRICFLNTVESSSATISGLSHIVEAKSDGTWVALVSNKDGNVWILTKTGTHKTPLDMPGLKLLPDTILVGELSSGSQQSIVDIEKHGGRFVTAFDVLKVNGNDVTCLPLLNRKALLSGVFGRLAELGGAWSRGLRHLVKMPMWSSDLVDRYNNEPEGLIAKEISDGPYVCGSKNTAWIKVKKCFSDDYIVTDWTISTAVTKVDRKMAESVTLAGWVPSDTVTANDNAHGTTSMDSVAFTLVDIMNVGAMTDEMSLDVAENFKYWRGKVIRVGHYKLFKSGAGRHPFILCDENGLAMIAECNHSKCIYRADENKTGGKEL